MKSGILIAVVLLAGCSSGGEAASTTVDMSDPDRPCVSMSLAALAISRGEPMVNDAKEQADKIEAYWSAYLIAL